MLLDYIVLLIDSTIKKKAFKIYLLFFFFCVSFSHIMTNLNLLWKSAWEMFAFIALLVNVIKSLNNYNLNLNNCILSFKLEYSSGIPLFNLLKI